MRLSDWFIVTSDRIGDPQYFSRSPLRSNYLVGNTFFLLTDILLCILIAERYWARLSQLTLGWLGVVVLGLLMLWGRALRDHRKVRKLFTSGQVQIVEPNSPLDTVLRVAAGMAYLQWLTFFLVGALLLQFGFAISWAVKGKWPFAW
jgi:hypothetical protein